MDVTMAFFVVVGLLSLFLFFFLVIIFILFLMGLRGFQQQAQKLAYSHK